MTKEPMTMKNLCIVLFFFMCTTSPCVAQSLQIKMSGLRNNEGNIRLAFYNNSKSFDAEVPLFIRKVSKAELIRNRYLITYRDLKPGIYGIAILDDENTNDKMDYGLILPKEGFGFSDYYHSGMTRPVFEKFDFVLKQGEDKMVEIKVRYL